MAVTIVEDIFEKSFDYVFIVFLDSDKWPNNYYFDHLVEMNF